jgi:hypothetical protein
MSHYGFILLYHYNDVGFIKFFFAARQKFFQGEAQVEGQKGRGSEVRNFCPHAHFE